MSEKFNVLLHDETWTLVVLNPSQNLVSYKWAFRIKGNQMAPSNAINLVFLQKAFTIDLARIIMRHSPLS